MGFPLKSGLTVFQDKNFWRYAVYKLNFKKK